MMMGNRAGARTDMQGDPTMRLDNSQQGSQMIQDRVLTGLANNVLSGGGSAGYGQLDYGLSSSCPEGVNQNTALLATAAAIAVGAGVIYRAVTLQQGRRRKRRGVGRTEMQGTGVLEMVMDSIKKYRQSFLANLKSYRIH